MRIQGCFKFSNRYLTDFSFEFSYRNLFLNPSGISVKQEPLPIPESQEFRIKNLQFKRVVEQKVIKQLINVSSNETLEVEVV
jgi:hypothetical protein